MKLYISTSRNGTVTYFVQKGFRKVRPDGTSYSTSKNVERIGTDQELRARGIRDPEAWARHYVEECTRKDRESRREIVLRCSPARQREKGQQVVFDGGYLFLKKVYYDLGLHRICQALGRRQSGCSGLNEILQGILYCRILKGEGGSGASMFQETLLENPAPGYAEDSIRQVLAVLCGESTYIQTSLFRRTRKERRTDPLFVVRLTVPAVSPDSAESPDAELTVFADSDGIPLSCTLRSPGTIFEPEPLERVILKEYRDARIVVCAADIPGPASLPDFKGRSVCLLRLRDGRTGNGRQTLQPGYGKFAGLYTLLDEAAPEAEPVMRTAETIREAFCVPAESRPEGADRRTDFDLLTAFLALYLRGFLEKNLGGGVSWSRILDTLQEYRFAHAGGEGYIPLYTRTELTDALHDAFGFRTDTEIVTYAGMKEVIRTIKGIPAARKDGKRPDGEQADSPSLPAAEADTPSTRRENRAFEGRKSKTCNLHKEIWECRV